MLYEVITNVSLRVVNTPSRPPGLAADFRGKTTLGVALIGVVVLTPFTINNFLQGRVLLV